MEGISSWSVAMVGKEFPVPIEFFEDLLQAENITNVGGEAVGTSTCSFVFSLA